MATARPEQMKAFVKVRATVRQMDFRFLRRGTVQGITTALYQTLPSMTPWFSIFSIFSSISFLLSLALSFFLPRCSLRFATAWLVAFFMLSAKSETVSSRVTSKSVCQVASLTRESS